MGWKAEPQLERSRVRKKKDHQRSGKVFLWTRGAGPPFLMEKSGGKREKGGREKLLGMDTLLNLLQFISDYPDYIHLHLIQLQIAKKHSLRSGDRGNLGMNFID